MLRAYVHASEVITGKGVRKKDGRGVTLEDMGRIPDGAVVYSTKKIKGKEVPDEIKWVGPSSKIPPKFRRAKKVDLKNKKCVLPGLVDCHTHMVFGGDRAEEFAKRCAGASYEEIAKEGGGILSTIRPTRQVSVSRLLALASARVRQAQKLGVRILEIKSGYGLSLESELRCLEVIQRLKQKFPEMVIQSTFLGAHAFPPEKSKEDYFREVMEVMLPWVANEGLADACDIFVDEGYFTVGQARELLTKASSLRLKIKLHGDELVDTSSAKLACELKALSVDHLLKVNKEGVRALSQSQTVAVLLPGTAFYLKADYAPARDLIDGGACVAIATDFNPGSSMCNHLPAMMTMAGLYMGMSCAEIFSAVTYGGAKALGLEKTHGTLEKGLQAHLTVWPFERFEQGYYEFGWH